MRMCEVFFLYFVPTPYSFNLSLQVAVASLAEACSCSAERVCELRRAVPKMAVLKMAVLKMAVLKKMAVAADCLGKAVLFILWDNILFGLGIPHAFLLVIQNPGVSF